MTGKKKRLALLLVAIALVGAVAIYFTFDPSTSRFFPRCPFLVLTGFKCPGCGSQRAIHALLTGSVAQAWRHNMMLVLAVPYLVLLLSGLLLRRRYPRYDAALNAPCAIWTVFAAVMLWWVLRNVFNW